MTFHHIVPASKHHHFLSLIPSPNGQLCPYGHQPATPEGSDLFSIAIKKKKIFFFHTQKISAKIFSFSGENFAVFWNFHRKSRMTCLKKAASSRLHPIRFQSDPAQSRTHKNLFGNCQWECKNKHTRKKNQTWRIFCVRFYRSVGTDWIFMVKFTSIPRNWAGSVEIVTIGREFDGNFATFESNLSRNFHKTFFNQLFIILLP